MISRHCIASALIAVSLTACGDDEREKPGDPHAPATADERILARRYRAFAGAVERGDASGVCPELAPRLARSYGCGKGRALRLPRELDEIAMAGEEIFAAADPVIHDEIQISSRTTRRDRASLIVFFRRDAARRWRVKRVMLGGYG